MRWRQQVEAWPLGFAPGVLDAVITREKMHAETRRRIHLLLHKRL
jgi:hypothetical protein